MSSIPGFRLDITGATGSLGVLGPKSGYRCYVLPRGAYASQDSTGSLLTFDSASVAARFSVGNWVQAGLATANIRQVSAVGGNSISVNTSVTVSENDRIYLIGNTEPTVVGGSATYTTPNTLIRQRDDDAADLYTNSMLTTDTNGMVQGFGLPQMTDILVQDGNRANVGSVIDQMLGVVEGISTTEPSYFGATITAPIVRTSTEPFFNVMHPTYGALGDNSTDDYAAIQAAIVACNAAGGGTVYFPGGRTYKIATGLTWYVGVNLLGGGGRSGNKNSHTRIQWAGAAGGTMLTTDATGSNIAQWDMQRLNISGSGTNNPDVLVSFADRVDFGVQFVDCAFGQATANGVVFTSGAVNFHAYGCRADSVGGYWFKMNESGVQRLRTFTLDKFTYDTGTGGLAAGILHVDAQTASNNVRSWLAFSNGSAEVNANLAGSDDALILLGVNPSISDFVQFYVNLDNVQGHIGAALDPYSLVKSTPASDQIVVTGTGTYLMGSITTTTLVGGVSSTAPAAGKHYPTFVFAPFVTGSPSANNNRAWLNTQVELANNVLTSGTTGIVTQASTLALTPGYFYGISGTIGAGTSIGTITPVEAGREVLLWAAVGTMGFSNSNTLRVTGSSINIPVGGAVRAFCTGTTWLVT